MRPATCNNCWRVNETVSYSDEVRKELLPALAEHWEVALVLAHHHDQHLPVKSQGEKLMLLPAACQS